MKDMVSWPVMPDEYFSALTKAREESERIRAATSSPEEMPYDAHYALSMDRQSGYGVTRLGELIGVFSLVPGRGAALVEEAIVYDDASTLDCFDGFLPGFYGRFGFVEYKREPSWTEGGPDVVYMRRVA